MNLIKTMILTLFLAGSLFAKDKDYSYDIKNIDSLKANSELKLFIKKKNVKISNAKANLFIFKDGKKIASYKNIKANEKREHLFGLNLKEPGEYTYVLNFNINSGFIHKRRGSFNIDY